MLPPPLAGRWETLSEATAADVEVAVDTGVIVERGVLVAETVETTVIVVEGVAVGFDPPPPAPPPLGTDVAVVVVLGDGRAVLSCVGVRVEVRVGVRLEGRVGVRVGGRGIVPGLVGVGVTVGGSGNVPMLVAVAVGTICAWAVDVETAPPRTKHTGRIRIANPRNTFKPIGFRWGRF